MLLFLVNGGGELMETKTGLAEPEILLLRARGLLKGER